MMHSNTNVLSAYRTIRSHIEPSINTILMKTVITFGGGIDSMFCNRFITYRTIRIIITIGWRCVLVAGGYDTDTPPTSFTFASVTPAIYHTVLQMFV